jgi:cyclic pyranopterin phosphate synthase
MSDLSHYDGAGKIRMVDVSEKPSTTRRAVASGKVVLSAQTLETLKTNNGKRTSELIPLCHQINLSKVNVSCEIIADGVAITAEAITNAQTGVEMEALAAVSVAALTIYDMLKAVQRDIQITDIRLESKTGGKHDYERTFR